jgi:MerR family transcriptional regulator, copper efflux regulator
MHNGATNGLMTVGQLSRRTGLSVKAIRRYEALGLLYSAGRSDGGYRLFDESALWCANVIQTLRSLGLTIKEIDRLGRAYLSRPDEPIGPRLAALLDAAERRIDDRMAELAAVRERIRRYRDQHAAALAGRHDAELFGSDPRRRGGLTLPPGSGRIIAPTPTRRTRS